MRSQCKREQVEETRRLFDKPDFEARNNKDWKVFRIKAPVFPLDPRGLNTKKRLIVNVYR